MTSKQHYTDFILPIYHIGWKSKTQTWNISKERSQSKTSYELLKITKLQDIEKKSTNVLEKFTTVCILLVKRPWKMVYDTPS